MAYGPPCRRAWLPFGPRSTDVKIIIPVVDLDEDTQADCFEIIVQSKSDIAEESRHARNLARMLWMACPATFVDVFVAHMKRLRAHVDPKQYE